MTWRSVDLSSPALAKVLAGVDVVVHLACVDDLEGALAQGHARRRLAATRAARAVLETAAAEGVRHAVVVTSAAVFGARAEGPVPIPDDAPAAEVPDAGVVGDLREVERVAREVSSASPGLRLACVRPAALVGEGVDSLTTRHFEAPRLLVARDATMLWQFCHVDDLASAVATIVAKGLEGPYTVGCPGWLGRDDVERLSGMRRLELSHSLARATAERLQRVGVLPMPASDLEFVVHPWVVSSQRLLDVGWRARHDNEACLRALLEQVAGRRANPTERLDRKEAALGAAGAAVALVGTAAVWRQAKVRQGRRRSGRG
ncbi:MAG: NAD-dependent epimerase/dehydratase family protein [Actinomycetes bacterium]